jgi:hypothetical protein
MALSRNEFFKNMLVKIVQNTGLVSDVANKEQMKAFVRAAKIDAAITVSNWNNIVHPVFKTLRSSPEHEYDVLDSQFGGLSGWTITTEPWATPEGMECLWDFTRGQPHSITGTIMCLAAQVDSLQDVSVEVQEYDDSEIRSLIECIDLNMGQLKQDLLADCYPYDCDSNANLEYSLARHISEIMSQLITGAPATGLESCFDDVYPTLSLEIRVSQFIYDALIPASAIEYCGTGNLLTDALQRIHNYVGQADCLDETPDYSTQVPTGPSAGNNLIGDGDNLTEAIKQIDRDLHSNKNVSLTAGTGTVAGSTTVTATTPNDTLELVAGDHIALQGAAKQVTVSVGPIAVNDLSDVSAAAPSDDDILRYDSGSGEWVAEALPAAGSGSGNVSVWLRPVDFDQRSAKQAANTATDLTADLDIASNPIITPQDNGPPTGEHTTTLHNRNTVFRKTHELFPGGGPGIPDDQWYAHNAVQFTFAQGMAEDDQLTYATFALPRVPNGAGSWIYPTKIDVTGYFFTQAEVLPAYPWTAFPDPPGSKFSFSLTSHQDPSGAAGSIIPFVDGLQMTQLNFNATGDPSGYVVAQSAHVDKDYRVCVLNFGQLSINVQPDMNGFITLRISPVNGLGFFDRVEPSEVYMLGLRVDFTL